mmetsp:Transcript_27608/g.83245  ORF Transcript_27608/g.83245 Transcript_27608/m.83245 type:complete len:267 (+) Transcript_27608:852-1652(+)
MRGASSMDRPTKGRVARAHMKKHHASATISINSTDRDEYVKMAGITNFAYHKAMTIKAMIMPNVKRMPSTCGLFRSGWMASTTIAQMSWKIRMPTVRRPGAVSISACSASSLTTIMVEEIAQGTPTYTAAKSPSPKEKPGMASSPMKMPVMMTAQSGNWNKPVPMTTLPILRSSLTSSSSPIMKSKKTKPRELNSWMSERLCTMSMQYGPTSTPLTRYPRISGRLTRATRNAVRPAVARLNATWMSINDASPPRRRCAASPAASAA